MGRTHETCQTALLAPPIAVVKGAFTRDEWCNRDFSPTIRHNPIDGFQASLLIKLEKLDWGSILDNKSDAHAR